MSLSRGSEDVAADLAGIALGLADCSALERVCAALASGRFHPQSSGPTRASIASGSSLAERHLLSLQEAWASLDSSISGSALCLVLRSSAQAAGIVRRHDPRTEVVWTGPKPTDSFFRATREIVREIVRTAHQELLVVGYWVAARDDGDGIIEELILSLANAVERSVRVTVIVDERIRADGRDNRTVLVSVWPSGTPLPRLLTWRLPSDDAHIKLHAKVLVADRTDALVTSANFTSYAMDRNMEMGVRVTRGPAAAIARHFDLLEERGIIEPYHPRLREA